MKLGFRPAFYAVFLVVLSLLASRSLAETPASAESGKMMTVQIIELLAGFGAFGGVLAALSHVSVAAIIKEGIAAYGSGEKLNGKPYPIWPTCCGFALIVVDIIFL